MMRTFLLSIIFCSAAALSAQTAAPEPQDSLATVRLSMHESDFFAYRITIRTTMKRFFPRTDLPSTYSRELVYFLSQRVTKIGKDGIVSIEANIDSMRLSVDKPGDALKFDSQEFLANGGNANLSHPELIGPSMVLNKPFTYRMTLEGDFIDVKGFESWIGQIDSAGIDSNTKFSMEEYMSPAFLRLLVVPAEGFVYGRQYAKKQEWNSAVRRQVFAIPVMDSVHYMIDFPVTHKRFFVFSDGKLFAGSKTVHDHGFKEASIMDSVRGTIQDTVTLANHGHIQELERTATIKAYLHNPQLSYSQDIRENTIIRLEGYEAR